MFAPILSFEEKHAIPIFALSKKKKSGPVPPDAWSVSHTLPGIYRPETASHLFRCPADVAAQVAHLGQGTNGPLFLFTCHPCQTKLNETYARILQASIRSGQPMHRIPRSANPSRPARDVHRCALFVGPFSFQAFEV